MIRINGVRLPCPSKYSIPQFDIDSPDTTRNERGVLQRDRVRQGVYKIEMEWNALTNGDLQTILSVVKPSSLTVKFITPTGYVTKRMYVGDRKVDLVKGFGQLRWGLSLNLIEY